MPDEYSVPIDDDLKLKMNQIAMVIDAALPEGWGFALYLFEFGPAGKCTYIANAQRDDVITAMKEWIAYQERVKNAEKN